jgi:hypothetical protein
MVEQPMALGVGYEALCGVAMWLCRAVRHSEAVASSLWAQLYTDGYVS